MFNFVFLFISIVVMPSTEIDQRVPLTKEKVRDYIETRVKAHDLQVEYTANADDYEDVIVAYYKERDEWLPTQGWTPEEYDATGEWINGVVNSMEDQADLDEENQKREEQFAEFDANEYLSVEQRKEMKEALLQSAAQRQDYINIFKQDWPAVKPYLEELIQLDEYIGGERSDPPALK